MSGFINFVREQGIIGLAVGFMLGGSVQKVVTALVTDVINPLLGLIGNTSELKNASVHIGSAQVLYGDLLANVIDFVIIGIVVYYGVKTIGLEKLDRQKQ